MKPVGTNQQFRKESAGYPNFSIPSGSGRSTDSRLGVQVHPLQKLWSFGVEELTMDTTYHKWDAVP